MTTTESQNIEFKESWRDEYLKWICGFANAQGGTLFVGREDSGRVCGVQDAMKLMEDLPHKVLSLLGILVEVNLKEQDGLQYLEIVTEPYPYPISFRGKYYQRSGATNQELKGAVLDRFMLRKQGRTWDGVPVPYLTADDLDDATFALFRKSARRSGRMDEADLMDSNRDLLEKLRLYENGYLKRAAALLFHPDPERFVTGAFVKIGFFREGMNLIYQDEVHGNLFQQVVKLMDLLCTKYMKAYISYDGIHRVETLPIPREALREALLNALVNKDYAEPSPIQIRVYDNRMEIVNGGVLPDGWTIDTLLAPHRSYPYNPDIANTFFRSGEIESWGRGIQRIINACRRDGFSTPDFRFDPSGFWTVFKYNIPEGEGTIQETIQEDRQKGKTLQERPTKGPTKDRQKEESLQETSKNLARNVQKPCKKRPKTLQEILQKLPDTQKRILYYLEDHPQATRDEVFGNVNDVTRGQVVYGFFRLQELGLLRRIGSTKKGYWQVLTNDEEQESKE